MEESVAFYITRLKKKFSVYCDSRLRVHRLTDGLFYYLLYIGKYPGCPPGEIARALRADNGHTTRCVGKLEALGYAVRTNDPDDGRLVRLALTENGMAIFNEIHSMFLDWDELACKGLEPEQRGALLALLKLVFAETEGETAC